MSSNRCMVILRRAPFMNATGEMGFLDGICSCKTLSTVPSLQWICNPSFVAVMSVSSSPDQSSALPTTVFVILMLCSSSMRSVSALGCRMNFCLVPGQGVKALTCNSRATFAITRVQLAIQSHFCWRNTPASNTYHHMVCKCIKWCDSHVMHHMVCIAWYADASHGKQTHDMVCRCIVCFPCYADISGPCRRWVQQLWSCTKAWTHVFLSQGDETTTMHAQPCWSACSESCDLQTVGHSKSRPCNFWTMWLVPPCAANLVIDEWAVSGKGEHEQRPCRSWKCLCGCLLTVDHHVCADQMIMWQHKCLTGVMWHYTWLADELCWGFVGRIWQSLAWLRSSMPMTNSWLAVDAAHNTQQWQDIPTWVHCTAWSVNQHV